MTDSDAKKTSGPEGSVVQDGISCPAEPPWHPRVSLVTGLPFLPIAVLAVFVLVQTSWPKLLLWSALLGIFAYPLRYLICARCPYYGKPCSTQFGRIVPRLFQKQEGRSMKMGLWLDVVMIALLLLIPLPEVWRVGGVLLTVLWLLAFFLLFAVLTRLACSVCPFTFCPIGRAGKAFWGTLNRS